MKFQNKIVTAALSAFLFTLPAASTISSGSSDSEAVSRRGRDKRAGAQGEPNQHSNKKSPFVKTYHDYVHNDITIVDHMIKQLLDKSVRLHDHRKYFKVKAFRVGIQV